MERFGFSLDSWYKAIYGKRLNAAILPPKRYDWAHIQAHYNEGHARACRRTFGMASAAWWKAVQRGDITVRPMKQPLERMLCPTVARCTVKRRLIMAGILKNVCDECGISEWRGKPLSIQIDHRNGIRNDNRLDNLRILCPNCHSQTETFGARNKRLLQLIPR
ncbi:MAG: hypothetical protein QOJ39_1361 [Candidatus Eremiobacteraeota bacterium]|jgi:hypothetical protein|nr:hypothetical protein [Candidatus Eremiobacteraeota bacterium]